MMVCRRFVTIEEKVGDLGASERLLQQQRWRLGLCLWGMKHHLEAAPVNEQAE
jgi:hypothetical protein